MKFVEKLKRKVRKWAFDGYLECPSEVKPLFNTETRQLNQICSAFTILPHMRTLPESVVNDRLVYGLHEQIIKMIEFGELKIEKQEEQDLSIRYLIRIGVVDMHR